MTDRELTQRLMSALGWQEVPDGYGGTRWLDREGHETGYGTTNSYGGTGQRFQPCTDANAALRVIRELAGRPVSVKQHFMAALQRHGGPLHQGADAFWWYLFRLEDTRTLCLAALEALGADA